MIWTKLNPPAVARPAIGTDQLPQRTRRRAQYSEQAACQPRCKQFPGLRGVPDPVAVRYAWAANPAANLTNAAGLPASPFRTDNWPGITQPTTKP